MHRNIVVLGDGLLGGEIIEQTNWNWISRKKNGIDFDNIDSYKNLISKYNVVFNAIVHKDTYSQDKQKHWNTNYVGVANLVDYCNINNKKIIHISTDYVYSNSVANATENDVPSNCPNWYTYTKLLSDGYVQLRSNNYLLIRCSFRKRPFEYNQISMQIGNFDYVDNIVKLIIQLIEKNARGIFNVGREKVWNIYNMAIETNPRVKIRDKKVFDSIPYDLSMNVDKMNNFLKNHINILER